LDGSFVVRTNFFGNDPAITVELLRSDAFRALYEHLEREKTDSTRNAYKRLAWMYEELAVHLSEQKK